MWSEGAASSAGMRLQHHMQVVPAGRRPHERMQQLMDPTAICGQSVICSEIYEQFVNNLTYIL